jgi:hypothetical protein
MKGAVLALVLLAGVACGSAGADPSGEDRNPRPRAVLTIVSVDPLTLRGKRFVPGERIKFIMGSPIPRMKAARADALGRVTVSFKITPGRCDGVVVQAFGSRGSRAMADAPVPGCAPGSLPGERP